MGALGRLSAGLAVEWWSERGEPGRRRMRWPCEALGSRCLGPLGFVFLSLVCGAVIWRQHSGELLCPRAPLGAEAVSSVVRL